MKSKELAAGIRDTFERAGVTAYVASPFPKQVDVILTAPLPATTMAVLRQTAQSTGIAIDVRLKGARS